MESTEQLLAGHSDREKEAYLVAIASIATADRAATEEELEFLQALAQSADLSEYQEQTVLQAAQDASNANLKPYLDTLKESELRFSLVTDLIAFAKSDGQYSNEEQQVIQEMASYLNIDAPQYAALNQFVNQAEQAQQRGEDLSNPGFLQSSGLGDTFRRTGINSNALLKGMVGLLAPVLIGKMLGGGRRRGGFGGGGLGGMATGGLLASVLGGGMRNPGMGGMGSLFDLLSGGRGYRGSGMGGMLGGLFGGSRRGGFGF